MGLRIVFFGTAELASESLYALARAPEIQIAAVVTQPDKERGRDLKLHPPAVKVAALVLGLEVLQPSRARDEAFIEQIRLIKPDLIVVAAYGQILPQSLLDIPRLGCLNVHTSLLPKYRGAAPIQWAIVNGDWETGVTIMKMDAGLDTGPIVAQSRTPIEKDETGQTLHDRLAILGANLLVETIPDYAEGKITPRPQPEGSSYARKIEKSDGLIDWREPAPVIERKVRAFTPWPGAFTYLVQGEKRRMLKILRAEVSEEHGPISGGVLKVSRDGILVSCAPGTGSLLIQELQPEGRKRMTAREFLAGNAVQASDLFTRQLP
jgi:methionyl-tRNA formyltransferase